MKISRWVPHCSIKAFCRAYCGSYSNQLFCDPHRDPHAEMRGKGERAQERKFSFLSRAFIAFGVYITCAMKLPMACAASSCFCRVAWV